MYRFECSVIPVFLVQDFGAIMLWSAWSATTFCDKMISFKMADNTPGKFSIYQVSDQKYFHIFKIICSFIPLFIDYKQIRLPHLFTAMWSPENLLIFSKILTEDTLKITLKFKDVCSVFTNATASQLSMQHNLSTILSAHKFHNIRELICAQSISHILQCDSMSTSVCGILFCADYGKITLSTRKLAYYNISSCCVTKISLFSIIYSRY